MSTQEHPAAGEELRILRARAYGPDADIQDDPDALRRLHELEEQARPDAAATTGAATTGEGGSGPWDPPSPDAPAHEGPVRIRLEPEPADDPPASGAPPSGAGDPGTEDPSTGREEHARSAAPWWRRTPTLWIASVAVAAIVASAVTVATSQAAAGRVAVLDVDRDGEWPSDFFTPDGDGLVFEDFHGLTTFVAPQQWNEGEELDCLYVRALETGSGPSTGGCAGGSFPPTAGMVVSGTSPAELRERFADGTALQFVARGSQVHVYADEP